MKKREKQYFPHRNFDDTIEFEFLDSTERHLDRFEAQAVNVRGGSAAYISHTDTRNPTVEISDER